MSEYFMKYLTVIALSFSLIMAYILFEQYGIFASSGWLIAALLFSSIIFERYSIVIEPKNKCEPVDTPNKLKQVPFK